MPKFNTSNAIFWVIFKQCVRICFRISLALEWAKRKSGITSVFSKGENTRIQKCFRGQKKILPEANDNTWMLRNSWQKSSKMYLTSMVFTLRICARFFYSFLLLGNAHYSKSQFFVQKFNFDKTPTFSRIFHPIFFRQFFSWNQSCQQLKCPKQQGIWYRLV